MVTVCSVFFASSKMHLIQWFLLEKKKHAEKCMLPCVPCQLYAVKKEGGYPLFTCRVENSKRRGEGEGAQVLCYWKIWGNPPPPQKGWMQLTSHFLDPPLTWYLYNVYDWVYIQSRSIMSWFLYISYLVCHLKLSYTCIKVKVLDKTEIKEETVTQIWHSDTK